MTRARAVTLLALLAGSAFACHDASGPEPADLAAPWPTATAAAAGFDSALLARAVADADGIPRFHALLVARHGQLVVEQYLHGSGPETLNDVRSVTKSVVSTLVGIALARGQLAGLDMPIARYLGDAYRLDAADSLITIRDLLTMSGGWYWPENSGAGTAYNDWIASADHVQYVLDQPHATAHGTRFEYNSGAAHVLSVVLQRAVGTTLPNYADDMLFRPLGVSRVAWEPLAEGGVNGAAGLELRAVDMLRLGQLYLQAGRSGDRQIVPAAWVDEATRPAYTWRGSQGAQQDVTYGDLWWVTDAPGEAGYFAWGYGGQFIYVVPALDLVIVTTTDWVGVGADVGAGALASEVLGVIVNDILPAAGASPLLVTQPTNPSLWMVRDR